MVKPIRARLYPAHGASPKTVFAHYQANLPRPSGGRFVLASDLMSDHQMQPYIHDLVLTINCRRTVYKFRVFFKRHKLLPPNQSIHTMGGGRMEGDVLLVACGRKVSVRNLRSGIEDRVADRAVKRHVFRLRTSWFIWLSAIRLSDILAIRNRRRFPSAVTV